MEIKKIKIKDIIPPLHRAREDFGDLRPLISSIKEKGLINPITVKENGKGNYIIIAGERRYKACKNLEWEYIDAHVLPSDVGELDERVIELHENIMRKDFTWQEEVRLKKMIHELQVKIHGEKKTTKPDDPGWSMRKTAELLGESVSNISRDIQVAEMFDVMPDIKKAETKTKAFKMVQSTAKALKAKVIEEALKEEATSDLDVFRKKVIDSYIVGDFLKEGTKLQKGAFDLIEIDPPYAIDLVNSKRQDSPIGSDQYNEVDATEYEQFILSVLRVARPLLKPDGWILMWYAPEPYQEMIYRALTTFRLIVRRIPAIWKKPIGQSRRPEYYLASDYEPFYYARAGKVNIVKKGRSSVFEASRPGIEHPTAKPVELMEEILSTFVQAPANILVPFAGSGSTIIAAWKLGMKAVGYDLSDHYRSVFINQVMKTKFGD